MLKHTLLILALVCGIPTAAGAGEFTFSDPIARQRAFNAEMENQQLRMQLQQYQMQKAGADLDHSIAHACDPDVLRQPGIHLLARLGACDQGRTEAMAQEKVAQRPHKARPMPNGPTSEHDRSDRSFPYYRGN